MKTEFSNKNLSHLIIDIMKEYKKPGYEISGLSVTINGFDCESNVIEDTNIRNIFDKKLLEKQKQPISTVANTIFPINLWNKNLKRQVLFDRYLKILPKLRKCPQNQLGLYFERMISFKDNIDHLEKDNINQLENIIGFYNSGNNRRSACQVSIWDPSRDQVNTKTRGFPCMQQIVFSCIKKELIVYAFYARQHIFERAYGNFLGLCNLGKFMSHELRIPLKEVKCYIAVEVLNVLKKRELEEFLSLV